MKGDNMMEIIARGLSKRVAWALLLFGIGFVAAARAEPGNDNRAPDLGDCQELQVPAGHKVAFSAHAVGAQIYGWSGTTWIFLRPEALLYADNEEEGAIGIHYVGPTWESNSGSYVVGTVDRRCTPDASAIQWLRLKAVESDGPGIFDGVTYIQRVNTVGGLAPSEPGDFPGDVARVPYAADYFFYRQQR
jgi:Protein of unknown function (DUF3455)